MMNFIFKTTATMKEYNCKKWYIDGGIITEKQIVALDLSAAIEKYRELVDKEYCITISNNALKNKQPMYIDTNTGETKQCGYVITAKTDFLDDYGTFKSQYIDLWVSIYTIIDTDFEAA